MRKITGLLVAFFFVTSLLQAQIINVEKTELPDIDFLGKSDSLFWIVQSKMGTFKHKSYIECYDFDFTKKWSVLNKGEDNIIFFDSGVITTREDLDLPRKKLSLERYISKNGESKDGEREVFNIDGGKEYNKLKSSAYQFYSRVSTTKKKVLFAYNNDYTDKYKEGIQVRVLYPNDSLSEIKLLELPYSDPLCEISNFIFDDSGSDKVFILASIFDVASEKKRRVIKTELFEFDLNSDNMKVIEIPVNSHYVVSKLIFNNGKLISAFLKSDNDAKILTGIKLAICDGDLKSINDMNFIDSLTVKNRWMHNTVAGKMGFFDFNDGFYKLFNNHNDSYKFKEIKLIDNNIVILLEKNYSVSLNSYQPFNKSGGVKFASNSLPSSRSSTHSEDILICKFNMSDQSSEFSLVEKKQSDERLSLVSHLLLTRNGKANLIFSAEDKNASDSFNHIYKINNYEIADSVVVKSASRLVNENLKNYSFQTKSFVKLDDDTFVLAISLGGNESYMIKVKLPD